MPRLGRALGRGPGGPILVTVPTAPASPAGPASPALPGDPSGPAGPVAIASGEYIALEEQAGSEGEAPDDT